MANPDVRSIGALNGVASGALTLAPPAGIVNGDLLVATLTSADTVDAVLSGWTIIATGDATSGDADRTQLLGKIAASESGSYVFARTAGQSAQGYVTAVLGADTSSLANAINAFSSKGSATTGTAITSNTCTPTVANCLIFFAAGIDDNAIRFSAEAGGSLTWTERVDAGNATAGLGTMIATAPQTTAAAISPTATASVANDWSTVTIAIAPAAGGGGIALTGQAATSAAGSVVSSVTVGLTGQAASFTAGSLAIPLPPAQTTDVPNRRRPGRGPFSHGRFYLSDTTPYTTIVNANITIGLTGQSITSAAGSVTNSRTVASTGTSIASSAGSVFAASQIAVTGQSAAIAAGSMVFGLSVSLTGQASTFAAGTVTATSGVVVALTGQLATFAAGTVTDSRQVALTGQSATFAPGTITASSGVVLALTGQSATFAAGSLLPSAAVATTGQRATFASGIVQPPGTVTVGLTGQAFTATPGSLMGSAAVALAGQSIASTAGAVVAGHSSAIGGSLISSSAGTLLGSFTVGLTGQSVTFAAGVVLPPTDKTASLSGAVATFRSGVVSAINAVLVGSEHYLVQRRRKRDFTVSACTFRDFPPKDPSESIPLTFDFDVDLDSGVTLTGSPVVTVTMSAGADPSPSSIFNGLPRFDITSTQVIVPVLGGLVNCDYDIKVVVTTSDSLTVLALSGRLPVR